MGYFRTSLAPAKVGFLAIFAITFGAFLVQSVFFERNLTPLVPAFMMVAVAGAANIERFAAARLVLQHPWPAGCCTWPAWGCWYRQVLGACRSALGWPAISTASTCSRC